jgi:hypothetical protein
MVVNLTGQVSRSITPTLLELRVAVELPPWRISCLDTPSAAGSDGRRARPAMR